MTFGGWSLWEGELVNGRGPPETLANTKYKHSKVEQ